MSRAADGRGRPRRAETDLAIREATLALLREHGPSAVTVEAVAARSGVARTTIYRRHRDRAALVDSALGDLLSLDAPTPSLPVEEKLRWVLDRIHAVLEEGVGRGGVAALLTDSDPDFADALRSRMGRHLDVLREAMADDVADGRLDGSVDPDTLVGLLCGAYLAEVVRHGGPRPGWAQRTVALLAPAVVVANP